MITKHDQAHDASKGASVKKLAALWPVAKGSLTLTRSPCTRKNCRECASGRKHPKLIFTFREGGRLRGMYVRPAHEGPVRKAIANGRELERLMAGAGRDLVLSPRQDTEP